MIKVKSNAEAFMAGIDAAIADIDTQLNTQFAGWTMKVMGSLVVDTPQWSGDTAANWFYSIGAPSGEYQPVPEKAMMWPLPQEFRSGQDDPYRRGSWQAVHRAMDRTEGAPKPLWTDKVFITNNAPIAPELETSPSWVRPVNLVGGAVAMISYTVAKFKNLPV